MMQINWSKKKILQFLLSFVLANLFLSFLFLGVGRYYVQGLIPFFSPVLTWVHPEYEIISSKVEELNDRLGLSYIIRINRPIQDIYGRSGKTAQGKRGVLAGTMYIYPTIVYSLLFAWPVFSWKRKLKLALLVLPMIVLLEMIDIPFYIIYNFEKTYISPSWTGDLCAQWVNLLNSGGRHFLSLLLFLFIIAPSSLRLPAPELATTANRNDPCPCGSGKKYKNCCMK